ncbi:MAG: GNAT family N-acetyltransferase [Atopobiaceae bacterium]|nr:GNAT family N-acetyltransferase [Atopobiaceae bacterium]
MRPLFVAVEENSPAGQILGYAFCVFQQHLDDNILTDVLTLCIDDLCADKTLRGKGADRRIYDCVVEFAREQGAYSITLNVWTLNKSTHRFYEHLGLTPQKTGMGFILYFPGKHRQRGFRACPTETQIIRSTQTDHVRSAGQTQRGKRGRAGRTPRRCAGQDPKLRAGHGRMQGKVKPATRGQRLHNSQGQHEDRLVKGPQNDTRARIVTMHLAIPRTRASVAAHPSWWGASWR